MSRDNRMHPNAFLWEKDTIWAGYRLRSGQSENSLATLAKYGFIYQARLLGRKAGGSLLLLLSFETDDGKKLFLHAIREEGVIAESFAPTQFDIGHAQPLGEVLTARQQRLLDDNAASDPMMLRQYLEGLDERDQQSQGGEDFLFKFTTEMKAHLNKIRKMDN